MPKKPLHPCGHVGCPELTRDPYCPKHTKEVKQRYDKDRPNATERGYNYRWQKARRYFLKKHPLCEICKAEGRLTAATVVDHIIPHRGDKRLFWNKDNWQALCKRCHDIKTVREDRSKKLNVKRM